jgi:ABC-type uncharacterized transport system permease subunit
MPAGEAAIDRPPTWRAILAELAVPAVAVALALLLGAAVAAVAGTDPAAAYGALVGGAVGSPSAMAATLLRSLPIVMAGIGIGLAFRAGAFNLGGEGQMIVGALVTAIVAGGLGAAPEPLGLVAGLLAGMAAGAAWALVPAVLQVRLDVPILITTLLLNYVGSLLAAYAVSYPFRDLTGGAALAQTAVVPEATWLPAVAEGSRLHLGLVALVVLPLAAAWFLRRTVLGYELRMTGANRLFAEYGGVRTGRLTVVVMLLSGAICGLGGSMLVLGGTHRYTDTMITTAGYAWSGFIAAILALANPLLTAVAGLFLGALQVGAAGMARTTTVPLQLADVVQAAIILVVAVRPGLRAGLRRLRRGG